LIWFLLISFFNGMVIETGRKIRAPEDEEEGVETYSKAWGRNKAIGMWLAALVLTAAFAMIAAHRINFLLPVLVLLGIVLIAAVLIASRFLRQPVSRNAKKIELLSGIWTLMMYLMVGAIPLLLHSLQAP
jgi:4-hydroxybenzoate polyprenyltransferase